MWILGDKMFQEMNKGLSSVKLLKFGDFTSYGWIYLVLFTELILITTTASWNPNIWQILCEEYNLLQWTTDTMTLDY